jgi:hypothetical protein
MWQMRKIFNRNVFSYLFRRYWSAVFIYIHVKIGKDDTAGVVDTGDAP